MKKVVKKSKRGNKVETDTQTILICALCSTEYLYPEGGDIALCNQCRNEVPNREYT